MKNLDEAMYTFGTGENFHLQNWAWVWIRGRRRFYLPCVGPSSAEQIQLRFHRLGLRTFDMTKNHIGVWEATSALPEEGQLYKFLVKRVARSSCRKDGSFYDIEPRPGTGAVIRKKKTKKWKDGLWMVVNALFPKRPVNIYEAHASSWN